MYPSYFYFFSEQLDIIGRGAFGEVRLCREIRSNEVYAMKKLCKAEMVARNQVHIYIYENITKAMTYIHLAPSLFFCRSLYYIHTHAHTHIYVYIYMYIYIIYIYMHIYVYIYIFINVYTYICSLRDEKALQGGNGGQKPGANK